MNERHSTTTNVEHAHDLTAAMRSRVAETLEIIVAEELEAALGAVRHERTESREGYRNGSLTRRVVTGMGAVDLRVPRARLRTENGSKEWRSSVLPRYQRRSAEVDEAILGCYLAGANTRRIRRALSRPLAESATTVTVSLSGLAPSSPGSCGKCTPTWTLPSPCSNETTLAGTPPIFSSDASKPLC